MQAFLKMAEAQGFEPWDPYEVPVFKTGAINHSAKLPKNVFKTADFDRSASSPRPLRLIKTLSNFQFFLLKGQKNSSNC